MLGVFAVVLLLGVSVYCLPAIARLRAARARRLHREAAAQLLQLAQDTTDHIIDSGRRQMRRLSQLSQDSSWKDW